MNHLIELTNIFLHLDKYLGQAISDYGTWTYLLLFLIVFCETGLVVTPFLPGDSLLFAASALAATVPALDLKLLLVLLGVAAILGDTVNYAIGKAIGPRAFTGNVRFLKREYLERTQQFYEKHGGKTIILARFVPIVRTFAPVKPTDCNFLAESAPTLVAVIEPPHWTSKREVIVRAAAVLTCWAITERISD